MRHAHGIARPAATGPALYALAGVHAYTGDHDAADRALTELVTIADAGGIVPFALLARALRGFVELSRGDSRAALASLDPVLDRVDGLGIREPTWCPAVWSILDALVDLGDLDRARAIADDLAGRGVALDRPFAVATAARARAMISAAGGDTPTALAEIDRALAAHERFPWTFERARTLLAGGTILRRAKRRRAAREYLHRAHAEFDRVGARAWAARAANELARIGGRSRTLALTPTEGRVAALVARGHSNAEVAGALFISTRTVAAHLTHIYTKLGVRSRGELARHLAAAEEAGPATVDIRSVSRSAERSSRTG
jgi:DNA-binding CsgD family transcriptional regulator